jgi:hypothetical protein
MVWATFWAIFSKNHLATLTGERFRCPCGNGGDEDVFYSITNSKNGDGYRRFKTLHTSQGCQMVCFQTKNPNLGKFWRVLQ